MSGHQRVTESPAAARRDGPARDRAGARAPMRRVERVAAVAGYFWRVYRRTWTSSIFSRFLSPLLFLLAMGVGLGSLVDDSAGGVDGVPYLLYVAPAMIAVQAMLTAVGESTWPVFGLFKWNRMYHSMSATPLQVSDLLLGHLSIIAGQGAIAAAAFLLVAAAFGSFASWWALLCLPIGVVVTLAFAVPLMGISASAQTDSVFNVIYRLVITPLMLFSGAFFPVESLPAIVQPIAWVTPLWHGIELCRAAAGGTAGWMDAVHLAALTAFIVGGWVYARRAMSRRLHP